MDAQLKNTETAHIQLQDLLQFSANLDSEYKVREANFNTLLNERDQLLKEKEAQLAAAQDKLKWLLEQIKLGKQRQFGRKADSMPEQLNLFDENEGLTAEEIKALEQADEELTTVTAHQRKKQPSPGRSKLPDNLPHEEIIHDLPEAEQVCSCGHPLHKMGEDRSEQLEYIPAQLKVLVHLRCKYACRACEEGVKSAPLPKQPIPKSIATPGLLAHVLVSKYQDHLPLYRQEQIWRRHGIDLVRATLCNWVMKCGDLFEPLYDLMHDEIRAGPKANVDETTVKLLEEQANPEKGEHSKSYMWVYIGGQEGSAPYVLYDYQPTRAGTAAVNFLEGFQGYLQTDGYSGYKHLGSKPGIIAVGCWAHARQKFVDVTKIVKTPGKAHVAVSFIRKLYLLETRAKNEGLDRAGLTELRQNKAKPILEKFKAWLDRNSLKVPPKSALGKAIGYALNQWNTLITYVEDGLTYIDNNIAERAIKPFVIGRKNWLFMGNERGAKAGAIIYSMIESSKMHEIDAYDYLRHILTELPKCVTQEDFKKLLPENCTGFLKAITPNSKDGWH